MRSRAKKRLEKLNIWNKLKLTFWVQIFKITTISSFEMLSGPKHPGEIIDSSPPSSELFRSKIDEVMEQPEIINQALSVLSLIREIRKDPKFTTVQTKKYGKGLECDTSLIDKLIDTLGKQIFKFELKDNLRVIRNRKVFIVAYRQLLFLVDKVVDQEQDDNRREAAKMSGPINFTHHFGRAMCKPEHCDISDITLKILNEVEAILKSLEGNRTIN